MSPLNVKSYCLSLYGCPLWNLSSSTINLINIAYNKILRKLWCLPRHSHRRIVHCVAETTCITNLICKRFFAFYKKALLGYYLVSSHLFCVTLLLVIMFVLVKIIYLVISLMIISCQTLLGRLDVCMVRSHPLRMFFVIFPVHKLTRISHIYLPTT